MLLDTDTQLFDFGSVKFENAYHSSATVVSTCIEPLKLLSISVGLILAIYD